MSISYFSMRESEPTKITLYLKIKTKTLKSIEYKVLVVAKVRM